MGVSVLAAVSTLLVVVMPRLALSLLGLVRLILFGVIRLI